MLLALSLVLLLFHFITLMDGGKSIRKQQRIAAARGLSTFAGSDDDEDPADRRKKTQPLDKDTFELLYKGLRLLITQIVRDSQHPGLQDLQLPKNSQTWHHVLREALSQQYGGSLCNFRVVGQISIALYDVASRREESAFFQKVIQVIRSQT